MTAADVVIAYFELGLRLDRHVDGYVDAYYGPAELESAIRAEPPVGPGELATDATRLRRALDGARLEDPQRRRWLEAQIRAMETAALRLAGEEIAYADAVERMYGVRPRRTSEAAFEHAHEQLDRALPGRGDLAERYQAWLDSYVVPRDSMLALVASLRDDFRERTGALFGLPEGEETTLDLVEDEPWAAFNYYLGGLRSRVVVNLDVPLQSFFVGHLAAHELYPGHHTEHAVKEAELADGKGHDELRMIITGPESLVSEGIAETAGVALLGDDLHDVIGGHVRAIGLPYDPESVRAVTAARDALEGVRVNAALMLHEDGASRETAIDYSTRWSLRPRRAAEQSVRFATDPTWGTYVACYGEGRRLVEAWVGADTGRFARLLREQLTPADLAAAPAA